MTNEEKLREIEKRHQSPSFLMGENIGDVNWLINRVKRLTEIIKKRCSCYESDNPDYAYKCGLCRDMESEE